VFNTSIPLSINSIATKLSEALVACLIFLNEIIKSPGSDFFEAFEHLLAVGG
jgi:hypothetical protein